MPTVTYLGDDSNQASVTWCNPMTRESIEFRIDKPVNVDPEAPENANRKALVKHIADKLSKIKNPYFKFENGEKVDGRTKEGRALKAG